MKLELFKVGHCHHPEFITQKGGSWRSVAFPAIVALLKHPIKGYILFDTGYSPHFHTATKPFPERLYRWTTPMCLPPSEYLINQLAARNIGAEDIRYIFISHFHADHIAGLKDFPNADFICSKTALNEAMRKSLWQNLIQGNLPNLLPPNFCQRAQFIEERRYLKLSAHFSPFTYGYDLFNDGALMAISLPGHAHGHHGLLVHQSGRSCFLVADACWSINNLNNNQQPHPITRLIFSEATKYYETLHKLSQLHSQNRELDLLPSHCQNSYEAFCARSH